MSLSVELPRFRTLTGALLATALLAACTGSEPVGFDAGGLSTGGAGTQGSGAAGTGSTGAAGTTGAAGHVTTGAAGTGSAATGVAGTGAGIAGHGGTTGAAGTGAAGTGSTGAAGKGGTGGGTTGAAGTGADAGASDAGPAITYTNYIEPMLIQACGGCHFITASVPVKGGFGISYANLLGTVTADHAGCTALDATKKRVVPGKPLNSLIYIKVSGASPPAGCGGHMPYMGTNMSAENQASLRQWILDGAKQ